MVVHELSRTDARRIAVRAQLLDSARPADLLDTVRQLTLLQLDPTAAIAPNADLVAWSRLGSRFQPADLVKALEARELIELRAFLRPSEHMALYRARMQQTRRGENLHRWQTGTAKWVAANDACRRDILKRLKKDGPLQSRELPDTCVQPWTSTGWTNNKNVTQLLEIMVGRGEVAVAGRFGRERLWDLAERVYPDDTPIPVDEAVRVRNEHRLRALGIARARGPECPVEPLDVGEVVGESAVVDGVKGEWRVDPSYLGQPFRGRAALLSPFDRLLHDRRRTTEIFEFDYQLEMYKPAAETQVGVLRASDPLLRSPRRKAGRNRRPQGRRVRGPGRPRGRPVHEDDDRCDRSRDREPGIVARSRVEALTPCTYRTSTR